MPLKIFLSSVSHGLLDERRAIENAIAKLEEIFVGMEYFGSDPRGAAEYDHAKILGSDLYIGLLADGYGSIESSTGRSFTELEYSAAREAHIPSLIYFKGGWVTGLEEPLQAAFKARVKNDQLVVPFQSAHELEVQFLVDLFKQLKGPLLGKMQPQLGQIPFNSLHLVTRGLLPSQVRSVGQEKYIPDLYIPRAVEEHVRGFIEFQDTFDIRSAELLSLLATAVSSFALKLNVDSVIAETRSVFAHSQDPRQLMKAVNALKSACYFHEVEAHLEKIADIVRDRDVLRGKRSARELVTLLSGRPFVDPSRLSELPELLFLTSQRIRSGGTESAPMSEIHSIFPSARNDSQVHLANEMLKDLTLLAERSSKRCLAIVDRAGRGKTNVICRIAEQTIERHPVVLLSGRMEVSNEYHIEWHIQHQLEEAFGGIFPGWIARSANSLERERQWLFVVMDGINETTEIPLLKKVLQDFLPKLEGKRIKLIVSCRDIYWESFEPLIKPYIFEDAISLDEYSETEWDLGAELYFKRYRISVDVEGQAAIALRNPLLLRFFCEAYQGKTLGKIRDIHLFSVFQLYVKRIGDQIAVRKTLLDDDAVAGMLRHVAACMWRERKPSVDRDRLNLTTEDINSAESIYNLIRSESVVLDETLNVKKARKQVRFVYDEFMEYMLAQYWFNSIDEGPEGASSIDSIVRDAMGAAVAFPPAMGAILFLDELLEGNGGIVNDALVSATASCAELIQSRQATLLLALEHIDALSANAALIDIVDRFELVAAVELKPRLVKVINKLLQHHRDLPSSLALAARIVEVTGTGNESRKTNHVSTPESLPTLPPALYHYSEDDKVSAISLIVSSKHRRGFELAEQGIRKLGSMDLHAALSALSGTDSASDDVVFKMVENNITRGQAEYRIYCAWLLRQRYGQTSSAFLLKLLSDRDTRVHRYTFSLFEVRQLEQQLLEGILTELKSSSSMESWYLSYRLKLLGRRESFLATQLGSVLGGAIATKLRSFAEHPSPHIRLVAYRSLKVYPEYVQSIEITKWMRQDADPYIQSMASG